MTKKHFEALAYVISEQRHSAALCIQDNTTIGEVGADEIACVILGDLARDLADQMAADNPRFDRSRFMAACKVQP